MKERRAIDDQGRIIFPAPFLRRLGLPLSGLDLEYLPDKIELRLEPKKNIDKSALEDEPFRARLKLPEEFLSQAGLKAKQCVWVEYIPWTTQMRITKADPVCTVCGKSPRGENQVIKEIPGTRASGEVYVCQDCADAVLRAFF